MGKYYGAGGIRLGKVGGEVYEMKHGVNIVRTKNSYIPINNAWIKREEFKEYILSLFNIAVPQIYVLEELPEYIYPYALLFVKNNEIRDIYVDKDGERTKIEVAGGGGQKEYDAVDVVSQIPANPNNNTIFFLSKPQKMRNSTVYDIYVYEDNTLKKIEVDYSQAISQANLYTNVTTSVLRDEINEELENKVDKTSITTQITSSSTDQEIPTAKAVYSELENIKPNAIQYYNSNPPYSDDLPDVLYCIGSDAVLKYANKKKHQYTTIMDPFYGKVAQEINTVDFKNKTIDCQNQQNKVINLIPKDCFQEGYLVNNFTQYCWQKNNDYLFTITDANKDITYIARATLNSNHKITTYTVLDNSVVLWAYISSNVLYVMFNGGNDEISYTRQSSYDQEYSSSLDPRLVGAEKIWNLQKSINNIQPVSTINASSTNNQCVGALAAFNATNHTIFTITITKNNTYINTMYTGQASFIPFSNANGNSLTNRTGIAIVSFGANTIAQIASNTVIATMSIDGYNLISLSENVTPIISNQQLYAANVKANDNSIRARDWTIPSGKFIWVSIVFIARCQVKP